MFLDVSSNTISISNHDEIIKKSSSLLISLIRIMQNLYKVFIPSHYSQENIANFRGYTKSFLFVRFMERMDGPAVREMRASALMSGCTVQDRLYGRRLLPHVLDGHAKSTPDRLYASIPHSTDLSEGFHDITCGDMAGATNGFAYWIQDKIGRNDEFETLAYMGIPNLSTAVIFLAAVKCGYKVSIREKVVDKA